MRSQVLLPVALLTLVALAGCGGRGGAATVPDDDQPILDATDSTGVIRALVVDEAVRPLAGVVVTVAADGGSVNRTTDDTGFAGFEGLAPGTYLVEARRPGYEAARQTAEVEAGIDAPPLVRFQLLTLQGEQPFYQEWQVEGFMQCAVGAATGSSANVCFIANYYPCFVARTAGQACPGNLTSDRSFFEVPFIRDAQRVPDWVQVELVWESTQAVSDELLLRLDVQAAGETPIPYVNSSRGQSPVVVTLNRTIGDEFGLGLERSLFLEVFTSSDLDSPAGLALNQQVRYIVHAFYGYTPPAGWRFSDEAGVPSPP